MSVDYERKKNQEEPKSRRKKELDVNAKYIHYLIEKVTLLYGKCI
jgi:hypothetical protein